MSGALIAQELGISVRTVYRDVAALQAQGAHIDGAPGLGYLLRPGFMLPPLMFTPEELDALALGMRWVSERADPRLASAARDVQAKVGAVLPGEARHAFETTGLLVGPSGLGDRTAEPARGASPKPAADPAVVQRHEATIRDAMRREHRLRLCYRDAAGRSSERTVWPFALGYFDRMRVLVAWCEFRQATRHFRTDRMSEVQDLGERYAGRRAQLMAQWRRERRPHPAAKEPGESSRNSDTTDTS